MTPPALSPGLVRGLHHVAFAEGAGATRFHRLTGLLGLGPVHTEDAGDFVERMAPAGGCFIQGLEAVADGVVMRSIRSRGEGFHHLAFAVSDIDRVVAELLAAGVRMVDTTTRPGGMGTRIAFAHPSSFAGILVEFVQEPTA